MQLFFPKPKKKTYSRARVNDLCKPLELKKTQKRETGGQSKTALEWLMYEAAQMPGPSSYSVPSPTGSAPGTSVLLFYRGRLVCYGWFANPGCSSVQVADLVTGIRRQNSSGKFIGRSSYPARVLMTKRLWQIMLLAANGAKMRARPRWSRLALRQH